MTLPDLGLAGAPTGTLLFLGAAGLIAGLARGFSGFGSALIFIPLASASVGPLLAAPMLMMIDGVGALGMIPDAWRRADRRGVFVMSVGALLAVPFGTWALTHIDPTSIRWGISLAILFLIGLLASGWRYGGQPRDGVTVAVGAVSGLLNGAAQIGGPPAIAYWLGSVATPQLVRANMVLFLAISEAFAVIAYARAGVFSWFAVGLSLVAGPAYILGLAVGTRMFGLASVIVFRRICYALIALAALGSLPVLDHWFR